MPTLSRRAVFAAAGASAAAPPAQQSPGRKTRNILCRFADPRIDSNDDRANPNVTVLEWLHRKADYQGKVAAFAAWETFPYILNAERAGFLVNAGYDAFTRGRATPTMPFSTG